MKNNSPSTQQTESSSFIKLSGWAVAISLAVIPFVLGILDSQFDIPFTWQNALLLFIAIWAICFWYFRRSS